MTEETLQEKYIREILDPRSALTPRENAAAAEIRSLREQLEESPNKKAVKDAGKREEQGK